MSDASLIAALALTAGLLALDTTAAFQLMLSQPLIAASIAGLIVGDLALGAAVGSVLQLVWLGALPVGAAPFPDTGPASVTGVGVAHMLAGAGVTPAWSLAAGVMVALVAGEAGRFAVGALRRFNARLAEHARARAAQADAGGVRTAVALGLVTRYALGAVFSAAFLGAALAILRGLLPRAATGAFPTILWAAPLGAAAVAAVTRGRLEKLFLIGGFGFGLLIVAAT